jgi:hypothetical protein
MKTKIGLRREREGFEESRGHEGDEISTIERAPSLVCVSVICIRLLFVRFGILIRDPAGNLRALIALRRHRVYFRGFLAKLFRASSQFT